MNKEYFFSKKWYLLLGVVILFTLLSGVFALGVRVGFHKAGFGGRLGERYDRNFVDFSRGRGMMDKFGGGKGMMFDRELPSAFSTAGEILDLNEQGLTVMDVDGVEKNVIVNGKTLIRKFRDNLHLADLKTGDPVVVMGTPNAQGQIEARLIRVMPLPEEKLSTPVSGNSTSSSNIATSTIKK